MNKELEALNDLGIRLASVDTSKTIEEAHYDVFPIIRKALTPPTSDEVCKALSEYYKFRVDYCDKAFFITSGFTNVRFCVYEEKERVFINESYAVPPHLIEMIGKFYKSLEKGE